MYLYVLYLLGWYTYEEETEREKNSNDTQENCKFVDSINKVKRFPESTTIIKNREMITDKYNLNGRYQNVINELKVELEKRNIKIKYRKVLDELKEKFKNN